MTEKPAKAGTETAGKGATEQYEWTEWRVWRHVWMTGLSIIVVAIVLCFSYLEGDTIFDDGEVAEPIRYLLPFATNLAGVLLFILATARRKGDEWSLSDYWGEHVFRVAQSFAYLFLILWAWPSEGNELVSERLGPNVLGFIVGLYIVRVERVVEAFGEKFEQVLATILPNSLRYMTTEERRRQQLRSVYRLDDIGIQWEAIRPQISDRGAQVRMDELIAEAQAATQGDDAERAQKLTQQLGLYFEEIKRSAGEILLPVEQLVSRKG